MTEGSIIGKLAGMAVPLFFCSIFQMLYSTVDAIIVGRYAGTEGLAAIGVTGQIIMLTVSLGVGLLIGVATVVGEYCGAGRWDKVRQTEAIAVYVVLVTYLIKLIVGVFLSESILQAIHTPAEVLDEACLYLKIIFGGGLFTYAYSMWIYIFRACGDGSRPMYFMAFSSLSNVILDLIFVRNLHWGVAGAAIGTVTAEGIAFALCLAYMKRRLPHLWLHREDFQGVKADLVTYVLKLSIPSSLQMGAVTFCSILVQSVINSYGTVVVAGYAAAQKTEQIVVMIFNAFNGALNVFTTQNRGAGNYGRIRQGKRLSLMISAGLSLASTAIVLLAGKKVLSVFVTEASAGVVAEGWLYLKITALFYICCAFEQTYCAVLRGMADALMPLLMAGIQVTANLGAIWILEPLIGKAGIWISVPISWVVCMVVAWLRMWKFRDIFGKKEYFHG